MWIDIAKGVFDHVSESWYTGKIIKYENEDFSIIQPVGLFFLCVKKHDNKFPKQAYIIPKKRVRLHLKKDEYQQIKVDDHK